MNMQITGCAQQDLQTTFKQENKKRKLNEA